MCLRWVSRGVGKSRLVSHFFSRLRKVASRTRLFTRLRLALATFPKTDFCSVEKANLRPSAADPCNEKKQKRLNPLSVNVGWVPMVRFWPDRFLLAAGVLAYFPRLALLIWPSTTFLAGFPASLLLLDLLRTLNRNTAPVGISRNEEDHCPIGGPAPWPASFRYDRRNKNRWRTD